MDNEATTGNGEWEPEDGENRGGVTKLVAVHRIYIKLHGRIRRVSNRDKVKDGRTEKIVYGMSWLVPCQ